MKTLAQQKDMFAGQGGSGFVALVEKKLGTNADKWFRVTDVAEVLDLSRTKVLEMIECGRLPATNLNAKMVVPVDPERPGLGTRPMMPLWRITHAAIMELAKSMEEGV